jgi:hypothetical protein
MDEIVINVRIGASSNIFGGKEISGFEPMARCGQRKLNNWHKARLKRESASGYGWAYALIETLDKKKVDGYAVKWHG